MSLIQLAQLRRVVGAGEGGREGVRGAGQHVGYGKVFYITKNQHVAKRSLHGQMSMFSPGLTELHHKIVFMYR